MSETADGSTFLLIHYEKTTVEEILCQMENFAVLFQSQMAEAVDHFSYDRIRSLQKLKQEIPDEPVQRICDALEFCEELPVEEAFLNLEDEREYFLKKNMEERRNYQGECIALAKMSAYLPMFLLIILKLVVPFVAEGLSELHAYSQSMTDFFREKCYTKINEIKMKKKVSIMENSLKGLMLAAGIIITCIIISLGFYIAREARDTASEGTGQINQLQAEFTDASKTMYDGTEVSGSEVLNVIRKFSDETMGILVQTNKNKTYYNYNFDVDKGELGKALDNSYKNAQDVASDKYINPTARFQGSIVKDVNGTIIGIVFAQV